MGAALDDDAGARRMRHRGEHGGGRGDADAGAVVDDHERQEAVEVGRHGGGADRERQGRQDQPVGELLGMVLHARIADRRRIRPERAIWPAVVAVPTRMARMVSWPSRMTVAAKTAAPLSRITGSPSPVMVFWSIMA